VSPFAVRRGYPNNSGDHYSSRSPDSLGGKGAALSGLRQGGPEENETENGSAFFDPPDGGHGAAESVLDLRLLSKLERVVDLDSKVAHCARDIRVA
jgi:hypothetical protein